MFYTSELYLETYLYILYVYVLEPDRPAERWPVVGCPDVRPALRTLAGPWDGPASSPAWSGICQQR